MKSTVTNQGYPMGLKDPVSLDDTVWTTQHIASYLGQQQDSVLSVVNAEGFPRPLANQKRNRRWLSKHVKTFFEKRSQGETPVITTFPINKTLAPKSIRIKNRTGS